MDRNDEFSKKAAIVISHIDNLCRLACDPIPKNGERLRRILCDINVFATALYWVASDYERNGTGECRLDNLLELIKNHRNDYDENETPKED